MKNNSKYKIYYPIIFLGLTLVSITILLEFYFTIALEDNLNAEKREYIKKIVDIASLTLETYNKKCEAGSIELESAKATAINTIKEMRFDGNNYFFIFSDSISILNSAQPERQGKRLDYFMDESGNYYLINAAMLCKTNGSTFITYSKVRPEDSISSPKLSYIKSFTPWNWYIGAGIYIQDIKSTAKLVKYIIYAILYGVSILALVGYLYVVKRKKNQ